MKNFPISLFSGRSVRLPVKSGVFLLSTLLLVPGIGCSRRLANDILLLQRLEQRLSGVHREILSNGITLLVRPDHHVPIVAIQVWVRNGSIYEDDYLGAGISHAIEHMIFKGTPTRPPGTIADEISSRGGHINAYTGLDRTVFHAVMPSAEWSVGVNVLADALMNASFPEDEWQKERNVILREMAMDRDNPDWVVSRMLWETAFRTHPYRYPVIGYEAPFKALTADDLRNYFHRRYRPEQTLVVIVGDVTLTDAVARVSGAFTDFQRDRIYPPSIPEEPPQNASRFITRYGPYRIGRLSLAYHTVPFYHPDAPVLDLLAEAVSRGRSSRLVKRLREDLQLAHEVSAWSYTGTYPGLFGIEAVFDPERQSNLITELHREINNWRTRGFTPAEVARARRAMLAAELSQFETVAGTAGAIGAGEFYTGDPAYSLKYIRRVLEATADTLQQVASKYLVPENCTTALLLPEGNKTPGTGARKQQTEEGTPVLKKTTLSNGLRLITRQDCRLPFVYVCAAFRGGLLSESAERAGITYLMSQMLTRGTHHHSAAEIAQLLDDMAASLEPFAGANSFGIRGRCLSTDLEKFTALLAECLAEPAFPESELEKTRKMQLAALVQQQEKPFYAALLSLRRVMFGRHPYRSDPLGEPESLKHITRADVIRHYRKLVRGQNGVVSFFGDLEIPRDEKLVARYLSRLPAESAELPPRPEAFASLPARTKERFPGHQAIVLLGYPSVAVTDRLADASLIIQESLNGMASALFKEIREKRGLVYYAGALLQMGLDPAFMVLYAGTTETSAETVAELLKAQAERIAHEGLRPDEVETARKRLISDFHNRLQDNSDLALRSALDELYGLGFDYPFRFEDRLKSVSSNMLQEAGAALFGSDKYCILSLLPEGPGQSTNTP